jgi:hypothetical protein
VTEQRDLVEQESADQKTQLGAVCGVHPFTVRFDPDGNANLLGPPHR